MTREQQERNRKINAALDDIFARLEVVLAEREMQRLSPALRVRRMTWDSDS